MYVGTAVIYWLLCISIGYNSSMLNSGLERYLGFVTGMIVLLLCQADTYKTLNNLNINKSQSEGIL